MALPRVGVTGCAKAGKAGSARTVEGAESRQCRYVCLLCCTVWLCRSSRPPPAYGHAFERDLFRRRFEHEVKFRVAAIHVAWGAEALCDATTQIEPFVLLSVHSMRKSLSASDLVVFRAVTGMDEKWRVVSADEGAPDDLKVGDAVLAINDRPLPAGSTRIELGAWFRGGSMVSHDDQGFWDVMLGARQEAAEGKPMRLTLERGRAMEVETQRGCAGSVTASSFDADPDVFWRSGNQRAKIPANAMLEAQTVDEFRWLAAFGTYFQASQSAIKAAHKSEGMSGSWSARSCRSPSRGPACCSPRPRRRPRRRSPSTASSATPTCLPTKWRCPWAATRRPACA
jgi:hypothetical protein